MRIAYFVNEYPPAVYGGLGTYATYMTRALVQQGHQVAVFTMNVDGKLAAHEVMEGVEVYRPAGLDATGAWPLLLNDELRQWGRFFNDIFSFNYLAADKMVELVRRGEATFDLVAVHDWLAAIAGMIVHKETGRPVVFHVHSAEWGRRGEASSPFVSRLESEMAIQANRVITVSHAMKEDLAAHGWPADKITPVWNGVDPKVYDPATVLPTEVKALRRHYGIAPDEMMILFVGRLTWIKGIGNLILAMPEVVAAYPKARLVILGKGEEQQGVEELIRQVNLGDHIIANYNFVPEHERIVHYAAADICIFPSTYEPFGIVSLEAMAMAKPVVVGANGVVGFREQIVPAGPDQSGVHVNGNDPHDIAWGLKVVLADREKACEMGAHGRVRVQRYFTWEEIARVTADVYEDVMRET